MPFLSTKDATAVRERLDKELAKDVTISLFVHEDGAKDDCPYCDDTKQLLEEVAALSDRLKLVVYKYPADKEAVAKYGIDKVPAIVMEQSEDVGIRFYGIPAGYEFATILEDLISLSQGETKLSKDIRDQLQKISQDVVIKVFVTPT